MIYLIISIATIFYFIFLFKNMGEKSSIVLGNKTLIITILGLLVLVTGIFVKDSGIIDYKEYKSILDKHSEIRKNVLTIKENIPILRAKLKNEPEYYQGWVMLAKSYIITDKLLEANYAYEKALSLSASDPIVLEEYISVLRKLDPKSNKKIILKSFDQLLSLDNTNLNIYNMKLNYSIDINDADLTKSILIDISSNSEIKDKDQYLAALEQMELSGEFDLKIVLSQPMRISLAKYNYIFFILREDNSKVPFAVRKFSKDNLPLNFSISSNNKMISGSPIPKNIKLYIKGSEDSSVSKSMKQAYESDILDLFQSDEYIVN